ncbi:hypothetical protein J4G63_02600 [Aeromonas sobria]|jgi:putative FmdB family regulatory protein|uniref:FmdB family zinc ribbon protein n=1 Tax=Aeromonas TaxID=642 RepID=UPI00195B9269|nr:MULTISPECIES: FmdB family zinc ribbon protein [Aeromonas]MBS4686149.1 hypothetical protein [Aeromonas sobria]
MPVYADRCDVCGPELAKLQKLSDAPLTDCPACSKPHRVKLISAAGFRLKGTGWYETDFKPGKKRIWPAVRQTVLASRARRPKVNRLSTISKEEVHALYLLRTGQ